MDSFNLDILVGAVDCLYARQGLSPPAQLRAAKRWLGLSFEEIIAAIEDHFDRNRPIGAALRARN